MAPMTAVLLATIAVAGLAAQGVPPMDVDRDLRYAEMEGVDPHLLSLDVYAPLDATDAPVAVWVQGGGWRRGDKSGAEGTSLINHFVREGWLVAALNYRLAPAAKFPAYPQDVAAGVAWVHQHAHEFGGDATRLVLIGHSAGAHLVALVGTDASYLRAHGLALSDLTAVIPVDTEAYDLARLAARYADRLPPIWGTAFGQDPDVWLAASPITHVAAGTGIPPMLIAYSGGLMRLQPRPNPTRAADAKAFAQALRDAGVRTAVVGAPEKTHAQIIREFGLPGDALAPAVFAFLRSVVE